MENVQDVTGVKAFIVRVMQDPLAKDVQTTQRAVRDNSVDLNQAITSFPSNDGHETVTSSLTFHI